ncbi:hypothetical protein LCGC14_1471770 [marine sediment metagenome]|uniref:Uncharacterized protein n=1 Tax=marine sediment metagenome TaxID=412755 RepID=A0A0F9JY52_9ZZZZ
MSRKSIIAEIRKERERQVRKEGWSKRHDNAHDEAELSKAAGCYANRALSPKSDITPRNWPWAPDWWKPKTPKRNLIRAAALIVAELERLERSKAQAKGEG